MKEKVQERKKEFGDRERRRAGLNLNLLFRLTLGF